MKAQEYHICADGVLPRSRYGIFLTQVVDIKAGAKVILRRCHTGDRACVSNFAHAPTRRCGHGRGRPRRSGEREEARRGTIAMRNGHPGEKRRKSRKCWSLVQLNDDLSYIRISYLYLYLVHMLPVRNMMPVPCTYGLHQQQQYHFLRKIPPFS